MHSDMTFAFQKEEKIVLLQLCGFTAIFFLLERQHHRESSKHLLAEKRMESASTCVCLCAV